MERNTFKYQREPNLKKSVNRPSVVQSDISHPQSHQHHSAIHLLQRWQELKNRELTAQQHNKQLLQQFEDAQDTLRDMLTLTANMKTIRMEYERYLVERFPHWQQQFKERTQAAQRKRKDYLKLCLQNTEDGVTKCSADQPLLSQNCYSQDSVRHSPYMQSLWQGPPQSQAHCLSHWLQLHHRASMPDPHCPWPRQNPPDQVSLQPDQPWSWTAGAAERRAPQVVGEEAEAEAEASQAPSSKTGHGGGSRSSHLSQELDIKPVRLPSCPNESSESSRGSSQDCRPKRGRSRCSSQESSKTSSAVITAAVSAAVAESSGSGVSSEEDRTSIRRSAGSEVGLLTVETAVKERTRNNKENKEESQSSSEESRSEKASDQKHNNKSESCRESGSQREEKSHSISKNVKNGSGHSSSSSESSEGEKESEKHPGESDEEGDSDENEDRDERDVEDVSERNNTTEEEEQESEEESDRLQDKEKGSQRSPCSEDADEDKSEESEDKMEEDRESDEEEAGQKGGDAGQAEEDSDSEDCIISPLKTSGKLDVTPEEAREEEEEQGSRNSDGDSSDFGDDDIEHLLAPQEQSEKKGEKDVKADRKPKAISDKEQIFQVDQMEGSTKDDHPSDSEEFDDFYD